MFSNTKFTDLLQWTKGSLLSNGCKHDFVVTSISTDTRTLSRGEVFLALKGDKFDGHKFIEQAIEKGVSGIILESLEHQELEVPVLVVKDSLKAFVAIAKKIREKFQGPVIAITGSAGKSSTKDMTSVLLGPDTVSSPNSFNNLLGVSKTLCLLTDSTKQLVLEMGMNASHEISEMCEYFRPEIGLITNIGDAHIGKLGGKEGIYLAKKELFDFLGKEKATKGVAVNLEDPLVVRAKEDAIKNTIATMTYSASSEIKADVWVKEKELDRDSCGLKLTLNIEGQSFNADLPIFGLHHAQNVAASVALAKLVGVSNKEICDYLLAIKPALHRGEIVRLSDGRVLIDESYNSNPTALISSLKSFSQLNPKKPRFLVLGDMLELGEFSTELHKKVAVEVIKLFKGQQLKLITVGSEMQVLAQEVRSRLSDAIVQSFRCSLEAIEAVKNSFLEDTVCLVKGSRGGELDRIVGALSNKV